MKLETSGALDKFAPAYVAFQGEVENASKNSSNPHFKSRYADLAEVLNTVTPVLSKHGLAILQSPGEFLDGKFHVTTRLLHASGQWVEGTMSCPGQKADPQGAGSATTYMRRYAAAAMCGIAQEDDDAEGAMVRKKAQKPEEAESREVPREEASAELEMLLILQACKSGDRDAKVPERVKALGAKDKARALKAYEAAKAAGLMK